MRTESFIYESKKNTPSPWSHQQKCAAETWHRKHYAIFWEMGCGKTRPIIDTSSALFVGGEIDGVLVVSDKGCYRGWEVDHLPRHLDSGIPHRIAVHASSGSILEKRRVDELLVARDNCLDFLIINVEALRTDRGCNIAMTFLKNHYALMVVDEATSIKNRKAIQTKRVQMLGAVADYRRIATGTPITQSPLDLFAMFEFLCPGALGYKSFTEFKSTYANTMLQNCGPRGKYEMIIGYKNLDDLSKRIAPMSSRMTKGECIDLPEKVYKTIYVEQTEEQEAAYVAMKDTAVNLFDTGQVTSTSALTTLIRLHQINCGHVTMDDKTVRYFESRRVEVLIDTLKKCQGKAVIWGHYQADMHIICKALREEFGVESYVQYHGGVSDKDRALNLSDFNKQPLCRFFVATPAAGGKGLNDLVIADTAVYYSSHYNLERRLQSEDRLHRPGQKNAVTIIDLVTPRTVDTKILDALLSKKDLAHQVLDSWRELLGTTN